MLKVTVWESSKEVQFLAALILAPLGRSQSKASVKATNRVLFFSIIDWVLSELRSRFDESREIVLAVAAGSPKSKHFKGAYCETTC